MYACTAANVANESIYLETCRLGTLDSFQEVIKDATVTQKVPNLLIDCKTENIIPILMEAKKVTRRGLD